MSFTCSNLGSFEPLVTGADVVRCYELGGKEFARELLSYGQEALRVAARRDGMMAASLRSAGSTGSSATGSNGCAGLTGTRLESIRKVDSWRPGSVNGGNVVRPRYPDGLCYGKLLVRSAQQDQMLRIGEWPTFGALARLSAGKFKGISELERFRLVPRGEGSFHVAAGGQAGVSFLDAVARYGGCIKPQPGTLVADVVASGRVAADLGGVTVLGSSRVGGSASPLLRLRDLGLLPAYSGDVSAGVLAEGKFVYVETTGDRCGEKGQFAFSEVDGLVFESELDYAVDCAGIARDFGRADWLQEVADAFSELGAECAMSVSYDASTKLVVPATASVCLGVLHNYRHRLAERFQGHGPVLVPGGVCFTAGPVSLAGLEPCWFLDGVPRVEMYYSRPGVVEFAGVGERVADVFGRVRGVAARYGVEAALTDVGAGTVFHFVGSPAAVGRLWRDSRWKIMQRTDWGCIFDVCPGSLG